MLNNAKAGDTGALRRGSQAGEDSATKALETKDGNADLARSGSYVKRAFRQTCSMYIDVNADRIQKLFTRELELSIAIIPGRCRTLLDELKQAFAE